MAIDHKAKAEQLIEILAEYDDPRNPPNATSQRAQLHATLYLADQQRIANLIALGLGKSSEQIREGLGL